MGRIIVVEGRSCVGKSTLVDFLEGKHFTRMTEIIIPKHLGHYDGYINWTDPFDSFSETLAIANMYRVNCDIVTDGGLLALLYFNKGDEKVQRYCREWLDFWISLLRKWDFALVLCLTASGDLIRNRAISRGKDVSDWPDGEFERLFSEIPDDLGIDYEIKDYNWKWMDEVWGKIRDAESSRHM